MKTIFYTGLDPKNYIAKGKLVHIPLIQIITFPINKEITTCLSAFHAYDAIIITSKTTVTLLKKYLPFFNYQIKDWQAKITLCVGKATAAELQANGIIPNFIAKDETAEGITNLIESITEKNKSFLWPHSQQARSHIIDFFNEKQLKLSHCSLYKTISRMPSILPNLDQFDEIVFTSPSTVSAFLEFYGTLPKNKILTSIGPVTEAFLKKFV